MSDLWTAEEIAQATGGEITSGDFAVSGISIDTRTLEKGDLFVALQAERDGHEFAVSAFDAGAAGALVSRPVSGPCVQVGDTLEGLSAMARASVARCPGKRVAITGSVGKTSAKDALFAILQDMAVTHRSVASYNNHWGVPLSLARMPRESEYGIFEIGTNHPGEIRPLSELVKPHVALITHVALAHLAGFGSLVEIAREKASIFAGLVPGGTAILPADNATAPFLRDEAKRHGAVKILSFGRSEDADVRVLEWRLQDHGAHAVFDAQGQEISTFVPMPGEHWGDLLAGVMSIGLALGLDVAEMAARFGKLQASPGRGEQLQVPVQGGEVQLVDDSYNANPTSMGAALDQFARPGPSRKFAVLGEMLEMGEQSEELHLSMSEQIIAADLAGLWLVGEGWRHMAKNHELAPAIHWQADVEGIAETLYAGLRPGDAVLIKGSNGSGVHKVAKALRQHQQQAGNS